MKKQPDSQKTPESLSALAAGTLPEINVPSLNPAETASLAYSYWEERGGVGGSAEDDWFRAETELRARAASTEENVAEPVIALAAAASA